jgi:hypothetical protein
MRRIGLTFISIRHSERARRKRKSHSILSSICVPSSVILAGRKYDLYENTEQRIPSLCIESYAFHNCSSLLSIRLPSGLRQLGASALASPNLRDVYIEAGHCDIQSLVLYQEC